MSVIIDMDKPERCGVCPIRNGGKCALHDVLYFDWSDEYAHCPLSNADNALDAVFAEVENRVRAGKITARNGLVLSKMLDCMAIMLESGEE